MKHEAQCEAEAFEEFCREAVQAARASEDEINAAADAPFLYQRLRARIASEQERRADAQPGGGLIAALFAGWRLLPWARWAFAVAALALFALTLLRWSPETATSPGKSDSGAAEQLAHNGPAPAPTEVLGVHQLDAARAAQSRGRRMAKRSHVEETETATEFLPLTYVAQADKEEQSGLIVRVNLPRESLFALGLPVSAERAGELVKADVIVGDDGLARAIRFIR